VEDPDTWKALRGPCGIALFNRLSASSFSQEGNYRVRKGETSPYLSKRGTAAKLKVAVRYFKTIIVNVWGARSSDLSKTA